MTQLFNNNGAYGANFVNNPTGYNAMNNPQPTPAPAQNAMASGWGMVVDFSDTDTEERQYVNLAPGYYDVVIDSVEKGMHGNTGRIGECPMATIMAHVDTPEGRAIVKNTLYIHPSCKLGLKFFFDSVGINPNGLTYAQAFDGVVGMTGRVEIQNRTYTASDGSQKVLHNDVKRWVKKLQTSQMPKTNTKTQASQSIVDINSSDLPF